MDIAASYHHATQPGTRTWHARRALLRATVFDTRDREFWSHRPAVARSVATGVITEVREDAIVLDGPGGTEHFTVSPGTVTWLGARTAPSALRSGDQVIIRHRLLDAATPMRRLAERIWARIGRVTGTIVAAQGREFLVDAGRTDGSLRHVVVAAAAAR